MTGHWLPYEVHRWPGKDGISAVSWFSTFGAHRGGLLIKRNVPGDGFKVTALSDYTVTTGRLFARPKLVDLVCTLWKCNSEGR